MKIEINTIGFPCGNPDNAGSCRFYGPEGSTALFVEGTDCRLNNFDCKKIAQFIQDMLKAKHDEDLGEV